MMTESAIFEHFAEWPHIRFFLEVSPLGARQWQDEFIRGGAVHQCAPRIVNWPTHSSRSSVTGSIDSARCAGIHVAISPSNAIARTTPARTSGSRGVAGPQHLSSITNSWASCNFLANREPRLRVRRARPTRLANADGPRGSRRVSQRDYGQIVSYTEENSNSAVVHSAFHVNHCR